MTNEQSAIQRYEQTFEGKRVIAKYSPIEGGIWLVKGEDPNCDMHGAHHQPTLGYFSGRFGDVLNLAVTLDGFWQWGGGGTIEKIEYVPVNIKTTQKRLELLSEQARLRKELDQVEKKLSLWS